MTRIASGCRVGLPASGRPVIAVHGGYVSYSSPRAGHVFQDGSRPETVMTVSNRNGCVNGSVRSGFRCIWLPLTAMRALFSVRRSTWCAGSCSAFRGFSELHVLGKPCCTGI
ncbi:hypothetical protein ACLBOM_07995 [Escherichia coli]